MTEPVTQEQETWLFTHFMRKRSFQVWLGIITLIIIGFSYVTGMASKNAGDAVDDVATVSKSLIDHDLKQARREGKVDATLESINKTLARIEIFMEHNPK